MINFHSLEVVGRGSEPQIQVGENLNYITWRAKSQQLVITGICKHDCDLTGDSQGFYLAVSSTPRPWIDAFGLPEKFNMAATESDLDSKVRKMSITFYCLCDLSAEHAGMELKCY